MSVHHPISIYIHPYIYISIQHPPVSNRTLYFYTPRHKYSRDLQHLRRTVHETHKTPEWFSCFICDVFDWALVKLQSKLQKNGHPYWWRPERSEGENPWKVYFERAFRTQKQEENCTEGPPINFTARYGRIGLAGQLHSIERCLVVAVAASCLAQVRQAQSDAVQSLIGRNSMKWRFLAFTQEFMG